MTASEAGKCSFCWQSVPWKQYARHLELHHQGGAVKKHTVKKVKLEDLIGPDFIIEEISQ